MRNQIVQRRDHIKFAQPFGGRLHPGLDRRMRRDYQIRQTTFVIRIFLDNRCDANLGIAEHIGYLR